jgi:Cu/Ag efflux protein CusF
MRSLICTVVGLAVLGFASVRAEEKNPRGDTELRGTVKKIDADNGMITVTVDGQDREFKLNEQTRFVAKASPGERNTETGVKACMSHLREGTEVMLMLDKDANPPTVKEIRLRD